MSNFTKTTIKSEERAELHEVLTLTGAEISVNTLAAGTSVPFVHYHKNNEEIYSILSGSGKVMIDNKEIALTAGDWLKISPIARRQFFADMNTPITYVCIQVKENSLETYTMTDAVIVE